jgi:hypothetical protein
MMTADVQRQGGKLQFLQSYHAGRCAAYSMISVDGGLAYSLRTANISISGLLASFKYHGIDIVESP